MAEPKVYLVHLRRPYSPRKTPDEKRDDPFYEYGSFGCTGCHKHNLLHPNHAEELEGARLAFVQGGKSGSRLVFLTPPITDVKKWKIYCEGKWIRFSEVNWKTTKTTKMPFKYNEAPILVWNNHPTEFPLVKQFVLKADGRTLEGRFGSKIRSSVEPLEPKLAHQVVRVYEAKRAKASSSAIASTYDEALPWPPPMPDRNRRATFDLFHKHLHDETDVAESVFHAKGATPETGQPAASPGHARHGNRSKHSCQLRSCSSSRRG